MSSHYGLRRPTGKHDPVRFASTVQSSSAAAVEAAAVTRADCAEARVGGRSRAFATRRQGRLDNFDVPVSTASAIAIDCSKLPALGRYPSPRSKLTP
jgi:hypothetical protein